ncbi:MAG: hypothetical protein V4450_12810 [Bacteroidota bacterium]
MKKNNALFCILSFSVLFACMACGSSKNVQQNDLVQNMQWQKDSLFADGDDADWKTQLTVLDEKLGMVYALSNDKENLYIRLSSQNEATIQRILRGGLTVLINNHGVKEEAGAAGISFPTGNRVKKGDKLLNERPELQQNKQVALSAVQDYSLFGFHEVKTPGNFDYGQNNPEGIELGIGLNTANALVYEAVVPLSSFLSKTELLNPGRKSIALGFILETVPEQARSRGGGGGLSIGGGLGFGSFGSGGGVGLSIGSGSLANIGGKKQGKPAKIWRELVFARTTVAK